VPEPLPHLGYYVELGAGEREAISLALEIGADVLPIDERAAGKGREESCECIGSVNLSLD
jgi:predicted nucleic acid-binding protein